MKKAFTILSVFTILLLIFTSCFSSQKENSISYDYLNEEKSEITQHQALLTAKESDYVYKIIADCYGLKSFYKPDYTSCSAIKDGDLWNITLKGTISGYTDIYKGEYLCDKNFSIKVTVDINGNVRDARESR